MPAVSLVSLLALCLTGRTPSSSCCTQKPALECHLSLMLSAKSNEMNATQEKDLKLVENHIPRAMVKSSMSTWEGSGLETGLWFWPSAVECF